jgi:glyoxylase-like metal-dependent hydrolase (beta-lactamase superfamily II)
MILIEQVGAVTKFRLARTLVNRAYYWTAAYFVDGLLVDTGCHFSAQALLRALQGQQVHTIVNTHNHEDHIGANAEVSQAHGSTIYAHPLALPVLRDPSMLQIQPYRKLFWGWPLPSEGHEIPGEISTERYRFRVLPTPGHSPDHIALYEPNEGWAFTGDLFIGGKDRAFRPDYDISEILRSLRLLTTLNISWLFPGSGSVRKDPQAEIAGKIAYLEELQARIRELRDRGMDKVRIARSLFGREGSMYYLTGGHFSTVHLVSVFLRAA